MNSTDYPQHTPELARLFAEMNAKNEVLKKATRKSRSVPKVEYQEAMKAYRAYWAEVDRERLAKPQA